MNAIALSCRAAAVVVVVSALLAQGSRTHCLCPKVEGERATAPLITVGQQSDRPGLEVCGYLERRQSGTSILASEFKVFVCGSATPVLEFDATQRAEIVAKADALLITEVENWPFAPGWKWVDVPFREFAIGTATPRAVKSHVVLTPPRVTPIQIKGVLSDFDLLRRSNTPDEKQLVDLIGRLLAAALTGDEAAVTAFHEMQTWLNSLNPFNAEAAELYSAAAATFRVYTESIGGMSGGHPKR